MASARRRSTTRLSRSRSRARLGARRARERRSLPLLRFPAKTDDLDAISQGRRAAARRRDRRRRARHRRIEPRRADAGAARRRRRARHRGVSRRHRACISWTISIPRPTRHCSTKLPLATTRFIAISKSGGTGETLMQTAAALSAVKAAGLEARIGELFVGISESREARQAERPARSAWARRSQMLEHDPGVGGRYSALTNVGLLPAAVLGLDIKAIRAGAAMALAPVLAGRPAAEVPSALGAALNVAAARRRQEHRRADGLCRPARALLALVRAALGREPRQGRQGHDAARRARPGRPAFAAAAVHRRPARQAVHRHHGRRRRARARASTRSWRSAAGEPDFAGKTIGDLVAAQGRATAETLAKNGCPVRTIHRRDARRDAASAR